ncbi:MAG: MFS transporter [Alphaproteobacteria bacterium]|nr:MFS transporter [Alphaproteobacteria bacterium]
MTAEPSPKGAWTITTLLFCYMLINFADKAVVGLAGVPIMQELDLTPRQFGLVGSSFFFLFSLSAILVGFVANRVAARFVILALALSWAVVQFPMVGAIGLSTLLACRIMLGAGEGPAFSVAVHALYKWFPDEKRTLPTAVLAQGATFGVILALPALNWIIVNYSWHWAFFALGIVGLLWVLFWLFLGREGPLTGSAQPVEGGGILERVPYRRLLLAPTFIGCCIAAFGANWGLSLGLTWFTPFIVKVLGFSQASAGLIATLPWVMGATVVLATGWLSQFLMVRGTSSRLARGVLGSAPLIVGGLIVLMMSYVDSPIAKIALLVIGGGLIGSIFVVCPAIIGEFTPVTQRASIIAIYGAIQSLAGILAPAVNGSVIESAATLVQGYNAGYRITAVVQMFGGLAGLLLLRPAAETARQIRLVPATTPA